MSETKSLPLLGRIAVQAKLITMDQLALATAEQARRGEAVPLGELLVEKGWISARQLAALLAKQNEVIARSRAQRAEAASTAPAAQATARELPKRADTGAAKSAAGLAAPGTQPHPAPPPHVVPVAAAAPPSGTPALAASDGADAARLREILALAVSRGASDLHLHSGAPVKLRVSGRIVDAELGAIEPAALERAITAILSPEQRDLLAANGELDLAYSEQGLGRFRVNLYRQQRGLDGVFRLIPNEPPTLEKLGLPTSLARHINYHQGMVLVTGPSGCGKTSTLGALVNLINEERKEHILTIEDPIEFLHEPKRCVVNQRSAGRHTAGFARALRAALREDPDVIVIGELRDLETISLALTAAETGHLVLATLHTSNSIRTINRLVGSFPSDQQDQVRTQISETLRAVVSQRLLPRADGKGRVAAFETLVVNKAVENLIRENKAFQIHSILQTGAGQGMGLLDLSIRALVQAGTVKREEALVYCEDPKVLGA
jgi:twitching motility protein PilT